MIRLAHRHGFTLLELLVAMALFAVILMIAGVFYPEIVANWRLDAAARQIVVDLQEVRLKSIAEGVSHRLLFSRQASSYRPQQWAGRAYEDEAPAVSLPPGVNMVACTARSESISFQPRGHAGTFGTITLVNRTGRQRQVIVDMVGRMRIQ